MSTSRSIGWLARATAHRDRVAVVDAEGEHSYADLLGSSTAVAGALRAAAEVRGGSEPDLAEARVAFMTPPGWVYGAVQWGVWRVGGIAMPLCTSHPARELARVLDDAGAALVIAHPSFEPRLAPLARERDLPLLTTETAWSARTAALPEVPDLDEGRGAMLLYTSGTASRPKGVLHTQGSLRAQVESLVEAWEWSPEDRILHVLPLHHTHGIVNAFLCALWSGATCEMLPAFDAAAVWERFATGAEARRPAITLFMAVPTIYVKLIAAWEAADGERRERWSAGARSLRLMVSGSAALPEVTFRRWREITGHDLLERYGMTEIGMALSNPLHGERRPGTVGLPLPGVELRLVSEDGETLAEENRLRVGDSGPPQPARQAGPGEIEVQGPSLFREYWNRPETTRQAFHDGWFRTGDVATIEDGYWRILGRSSIDIIKSGGYKISALEIEEVLRGHPDVADCAVVGLADPEWGERVAAAVVPAPGRSGAAGGRTEVLAAWAREQLAGYKVPRRWLWVERLPRNAVDKVTKTQLCAMFRGDAAGREGDTLRPPDREPTRRER